MKVFLMTFSITSLLTLTRLEAQLPYRADLLQQERAAKTSEVTPPQRTTIEWGMIGFQEAMKRYNDVMGDENGLHYSSGHFPAGAGFKVGVGYAHYGKWVNGYAEPDRPNRLDFHVNVAYSSREYYETRSDVQLMNIGGSIFNVGLHGQYFENPEDDFFGIGSDTRKEDRTNYLYRSLEGGGDAWLSPIRGFRAGGGVSYLSPSVGSGRDSRFASLEQVFDPSTVPGFDGRLPDFLRVDAFVDYDHRDNPLHPRTGSYFGTKFSNFRDRHLDKYHFRRWEFDAQQYLRFHDGYKVLALRGNVVMTDAGPNEEVPFFYMPDLGGAQRLRGFREFRFRDRNSVLATVEYRWEAWWPLDMALFVDGGKVAARRADIDLTDWEGSYGLGLRFHSKKAFEFRLDLAFSREGFIPLFRAEHIF
jgi:outer membrane protein assembly factor BamA